MMKQNLEKVYAIKRFPKNELNKVIKRYWVSENSKLASSKYFKFGGNFTLPFRLSDAKIWFQS